MVLAAPQGLEPQSLVPKTSVLPLDEGALQYIVVYMQMGEMSIKI